MAMKQKTLQAYAKQFAQDIAEGKRSWISFLDSASFTYKYRFANQMAIHIQRPEAKACTSMEQWNRMRRSVKKGVEAIRLYEKDRFSEKSYVFAEEDTINRRTSKQPVKLWFLPNDSHAVMKAYIAQTYDLNDENTAIEELVTEAVNMEVTEQYMAFVDRFVENNPQLCTEALTADLDKVYGILKNSAQYIALNRLGFDVSNFKEEDFDFQGVKTRELLDFEHFLECGNMIQNAGSDFLEDIEKQVKLFLVKQRTLTYNRAKEVERSIEKDEHEDRIQNSREHQDSGISGSSAAGGRSGQIREDEGRIPLRNEADALLDAEHRGNAEGTPDEHRQGSGSDEGKLHQEDESEEESQRGIEANRSTEVDAGNGRDLPGSGSLDSAGTHRELNVFMASSEVPYFYEKSAIMALMDELVNRASEKREDIYQYYAEHYELDDQVAYIKGIADDAYTEILHNGERYGYKAFENGVLLWKGAYLTREAETLYKWRTVSSFVEGFALEAFCKVNIKELRKIRR